MNGRTKGSVAEREVAELLAEWWQKHDPTADFCRTPLSGGWGNPARRGSYKASGDIMTTSASFPFVVEVKRRESFSFDSLVRGLRGGKSPVWGWWAQTCVAANEQGGVPQLWLKRNREPWYVVMLADLSVLVPSRFVYAKALPVPASEQRVTVVSAKALLATPPERVLHLLQMLNASSV